jgi:hypothetical protein
LILNEKIDLCISVVPLIFPFVLSLDLKCSSMVLFPVSGLASSFSLRWICASVLKFWSSVTAAVFLAPSLFRFELTPRSLVCQYVFYAGPHSEFPGCSPGLCERALLVLPSCSGQVSSVFLTDLWSVGKIAEPTPREEESIGRFRARDLSPCSHDFLTPLVAEHTDPSFPAEWSRSSLPLFSSIEIPVSPGVLRVSAMVLFTNFALRGADGLVQWPPPPNPILCFLISSPWRAYCRELISVAHPIFCCR